MHSTRPGGVVGVALLTVLLCALVFASDANDAVDARVDDLLLRLTLDEKLSMLSGVGFETRPIDRLGIPALHMVDGPAGVREPPATAFPAGMALAASFDPTLVANVGRTIAREAKAKGKHVLLAPTVNIVRAPHSGRNFESFGEDPYLAARMAVAYVKGVQAEGVMAAVKHYAVNNQEYERHTIDVRVDERTLHEIYLPAFRAAVQEGGAWSVMAAYNKVNGEEATENRYLLTDVLKRKWGFRGFVMSDWDAVESTVPVLRAGLDLEMPHGRFLDAPAVKRALDAGEITITAVDDSVRRILRAMVSMGLLDGVPRDRGALETAEHRRVALEAARAGIVLLKNERSLLPLDSGRVRSIAVIGPNASVARLGGGGSAKVIPTYSVSPLEGLTRRAGSAIRLEHAPGAIALEDTAPIPADALQPGDGAGQGLLGEYYANLDFQGAPALRRVEAVNFRWGTGSPADGVPSEAFSIRWTGTLTAPATGRYVLSLSSNDGGRLYLDDRPVIDLWSDHATLTGTTIVDLEAGMPRRVRIDYYEKQGNADVSLGWRRIEGDPLKDAAAAAARADVAIVFAGLSDAVETEAKDREDLHLPAPQVELIRAVAAANSNLVVVLNSGGPLLMDGWLERVPALVHAFYLGQETGTALAEVLFGDVDPSGRLPLTFPRRWEDSPAFGRYPGKAGAVHYDEGVFVGYRHFDLQNIDPLFAFGHGLSYTRFRYAGLALVPGADGVSVRFQLENAGSREGSEAPQVYVRDLSPRLTRPRRELKAFQKLVLRPGEKRHVEVKLPFEAFAFYDTSRDAWVPGSGPFEIEVGSSSRDIRLNSTVILD